MIIVNKESSDREKYIEIYLDSATNYKRIRSSLLALEQDHRTQRGMGGEDGKRKKKGGEGKGEEESEGHIII